MAKTKAGRRYHLVLYSRVINRWWRNDQAAAEQWLQSTPDLPDAIRNLPSRWRSREPLTNQDRLR